jgi:hypothetical protein
MKDHCSNLTTASLFQRDKYHIALVKRDDLEWDELFPLSIRQTQFPAYFSATNEREWLN